MRLQSDLLEAAAYDAGLAPASLVVLPLDGDGAAASLNPNQAFYPASMIKVPLVAAMLAFVADDDGPALESKVTIAASNMTANDAVSPLVPEYQTTLLEIMQLAIERSDNVATNVLFDVIGRQRATAIARDTMHLPETQFHRKLSGSDPPVEDPQWDGARYNRHPPADAAALFAAIARDAVPQAGLLREMLAAQQWNDKLNGGLRSEDRFLHKTGDTDEVTHDGGILVTGEGRRYVVVAYTGLPSTDENNARFGPFMRAIRELL